MAENQSYTLSNLMDELQLVIRSSFDQSYWVVAEVANVSSSPRGHMYMELVEKTNTQIIAKARANLWSYRKNQIIASFEDISRQSIKNGMKLMLQVSVEFHAVYGISLQILDIDPAYSLGELERQRQETINRLQQEGLLDFNKQYVLPTVIQNIAIISSETAAGYQDFINHLENNNKQYQFNPTLFPAVMQGEQAVNTIIQAFDKLEKSKTEFDVIVIIRGGGSNLDLACFDDYTLNARISQSYFPVLSGIGHERDQSVTDMVAHTRLKTPTAVADFILNYNAEFEKNMLNISASIFNTAKEILNEHFYLIERSTRVIAESSRKLLHTEENVLQQSSFQINRSSLELVHNNKASLKQKISSLAYLSKSLKDKNTYELNHQFKQFSSAIPLFFKSKKEQNEELIKGISHTALLIDKQNDRLNYLKNTIKLSNPQLILKKGFSITRLHGKAIHDISLLKNGSTIETELYKGKLMSKIINRKNNE
ncbi:MAG: exodeoxyribonuclease VII large subunit [Bacteroidales bacterium]|nr:exodeoxyribonuclease VII large subunit [Bacteroidales bacterium]